MVKNVAVGPWSGESGESGESWSFTTDGAISRITLTYSDAISSIFLESWKFDDENESKLQTDKFGTPHDGDTKEEIIIDTDTEVLRGISGTMRKLEGSLVVSSLSFSTTKRQLGPFGTFIGQGFMVKVAEDGGVVNGFHGSVGSWINSIGPYLTNDKSLKIEAWGGPGGDPFSYMLQGSISKVKITHGDVVNSIIFTSKDANGDLHVSPKFGTHDGPNVDEIEIDPAKETINGISGFYDKYVSGISFHSSLGKEFGPFGHGWGKPFSLPIKDGAIEGFHGHSGWYIDAIGLYLKPSA